MKEAYRCGGCQALLFKAEHGALAGLVEIKCRRCRQINQLRPVRTRTPSPSPSAR
ncbi:Com family DNA-binding transcriptional regulator [Novosphingobium sp.]|uniref:Com family DNA-binding transcriptional regulator n=1 Tax=Novosphingobium sp. TaxID=1874826 RepID=UPI003704B7BE